MGWVHPFNFWYLRSKTIMKSLSREKINPINQIFIRIHFSIVWAQSSFYPFTKVAILGINPHLLSKKWQYKLVDPLILLSSWSFHKLLSDCNYNIELRACELSLGDLIVHLWVFECLINEAVIYFCLEGNYLGFVCFCYIFLA